MICAFCGEEFHGRPVFQGGQNYCSIECANTDADVSDEEDEYYEEDPLDFNSGDDDDDDVVNDDEF